MIIIVIYNNNNNTNYSIYDDSDNNIDNNHNNNINNNNNIYNDSDENFSFRSENICRLDHHHFPTFKSAETALVNAAAKDNCALVCSDHHNNITSSIYSCVHFGNYKKKRNLNMTKSKYFARTKKCNCPMRVSIINPQRKYFMIRVLEGIHYFHLPSFSSTSYYQNRLLNEEEKDFLKHLINNDNENRSTFLALKSKFPENKSIPYDIKNFKAKIKKENLKEKTEMQALIEKIHQLNWKYIIRYDEKKENKEIIGFLFIPSYSEFLIKYFHSIFLIDNTYKTNKSEFNLIEIVGITNTFSTFNAVYFFSFSETTEDYKFMFENISKLLNNSFNPTVFGTDRCLALMNSITSIFRRVKSYYVYGILIKESVQELILILII
jgi:hypothetical protein